MKLGTSFLNKMTVGRAEIIGEGIASFNCNKTKKLNVEISSSKAYSWVHAGLVRQMAKKIWNWSQNEWNTSDCQCSWKTLWDSNFWEPWQQLHSKILTFCLIDFFRIKTFRKAVSCFTGRHVYPLLQVLSEFTVANGCPKPTWSSYLQ